MIISGTFFILLFCVTLINGQDSVFMLEANCGILKLSSRDRIINGVPANIIEHPWMAFISTTNMCYGNSGRICSSQCGGTLITNSFVLTAAHCELFISRTTVTLGKFSAYANSVGLAEIILHQGYRESVYPSNDIALLRLARTVMYSDYTKPICVTNYRNLLNLNSPMFAAGWGVTEQGNVSNVLRKTQLWLYDRFNCLSEFGSLSSSQICAGSQHSDTCHGDSGGPLMGYYLLNGKYRVTQLGIVSYGSEECNGLGVYTNVMHYFDWIVNNILWRTKATPVPT